MWQSIEDHLPDIVGGALCAAALGLLQVSGLLDDTELQQRIKRVSLEQRASGRLPLRVETTARADRACVHAQGRTPNCARVVALVGR